MENYSPGEKLFTLLEVKDLKVYYKVKAGYVKAVDGVNFNLGVAERLAVVGESGSGKTTLGLSIAGLITEPGEIMGGNLIFKGRDLIKMSREELRQLRGSQISMIFQDPSTALNPVLRVGEQIAEVFKAHGYDKETSDEKAVELLKHVGIPDPEKRFHDYPHQLSGGMKQRVVIAIAVALKPSLIIADEPTSALDVTIQAQILDLLKSLSTEANSSILLITHDIGVAAELSERIAVMYAGKLVEIGDLKKVVNEPLHPYTKALMASIPRGNKRQLRLKAIKGSVPSLINPPSGCRFHPRCPEATELCKKVEPKEVTYDGRKVLCHLYH